MASGPPLCPCGEHLLVKLSPDLRARRAARESISCSRYRGLVYFHFFHKCHKEPWQADARSKKGKRHTRPCDADPMAGAFLNMPMCLQLRQLVYTRRGTPRGSERPRGRGRGQLIEGNAADRDRAHTRHARGTHAAHTGDTHGTLRNMGMRVLRNLNHLKAFLPDAPWTVIYSVPRVSRMCAACVPRACRVRAVRSWGCEGSGATRIFKGRCVVLLLCL